MLLAVSSRLAACSSVRRLRSVLPMEISPEAVEMAMALSCTCSMDSRRLLMVLLRMVLIWPSSSLVWMSEWMLRSPPATASRTSPNRFNGRVMARVMTMPVMMPKATPTPMMTSIMVVAALARAALASAESLASFSFMFWRTSRASFTLVWAVAPSPRMRASASFSLPAAARARVFSEIAS